MKTSTEIKRALNSLRTHPDFRGDTTSEILASAIEELLTLRRYLEELRGFAVLGRHMAATMTPKQQDLLRFIRDFWAEHNHAPSLSEMSDEFGISRATVHQHLGALKHKGMVVAVPNRSRSVALTAAAYIHFGEDAEDMPPIPKSVELEVKE